MRRRSARWPRPRCNRSRTPRSSRTCQDAAVPGRGEGLVEAHPGGSWSGCTSTRSTCAPRSTVVHARGRCDPPPRAERRPVALPQDEYGEAAVVLGHPARGEHVEVHVHEVVVQADRERRDSDVLAGEPGDHRSAGCGERRDRADGPFDGLRGNVRPEIHVRRLIIDPLREGSCHGHREDIRVRESGRLDLGSMTRMRIERGGDDDVHRRTFHRGRSLMPMRVRASRSSTMLPRPTGPRSRRPGFGRARSRTAARAPAAER
jgi:hypothetical protein